MKVNDASFPCPPSAPSHMLFIILEGETLAHPGIFPFQILFSAYPLQGSHWKILADWSGGCEEGGLQFMAGEESLDSKCIWKRGRESDTEDHRGSSKVLVLPFPMGKERSGGPSSSSSGHKCFVFATSKAPGHSFRVFLNSKVCKVVAEDLGKALLGQLLLQSRMESHLSDGASLVPWKCFLWFKKDTGLPAMLPQLALLPASTLLWSLSFNIIYTPTLSLSHMDTRLHSHLIKISEEDRSAGNKQWQCNKKMTC